MYYFSNGTKFTSKIEALEYSLKSKLFPRFYYFDDIYGKVNWKIEPPEKLSYYYLQQAIRLREKYDYIVLCYSGGYDSTHMLETFALNNIKIDKIITIGAISQDSSENDDSNANGELYHNAIPYIKELGLESIYEIFDYTKYFDSSKNFSVSQYSTDWTNHLSGNYSPHTFFWRDLEKYAVNESWRDKKTALLFGRDRPTYNFSIHHPGKRCFYFVDSLAITLGNSFGNEYCDRVNFYWDPHFPEILLKQLHILNKIYTYYKTNKNESAVYINGNLHQLIMNRPMHELIYDIKRPLIHKSPKSKNLALSVRDSFFNKKHNSEIFDFYRDGIKATQNRINLNSIVMPILSREYTVT